MRKNILIILIVILLCSATACSIDKPSISPAFESEETATPGATETVVLPVVPSVPEATATQPADPGTPTVAAPIYETILPENASLLALVSVYGRGQVSRTQKLNNGLLLVQSSLGVYLYQVEPFVEKSFFEGARFFAVSPDEQRVVTTHADGVVNVWGTLDGQLIQTYAHALKEYAIPWDTRDAKADYKDFNLDDFGTAAFFADSKRFAAGYIDGTLSVFEVGKPDPVLVVDDPLLRTAPIDVMISPDQQSIISLHGIYIRFDDGMFYVYAPRLCFIRVADGKIFSWQSNPGMLLNTRLTPDQRQLLTVTDNSIRMWDIATGKENGLFRTSMNTITSFSFSADGTEIDVSGLTGEEKTHHLLKFPAGNMISILPPVEDNDAYDKVVIDKFLFEAHHYAGLLGLRPVDEYKTVAFSRAYWLAFPEGVSSSFAYETGAGLFYSDLNQAFIWCDGNKLSVLTMNSDLKEYDIQAKKCNGVWVSPSGKFAIAGGSGKYTSTNLLDGTSHELTGLPGDIAIARFSIDEKVLVTGTVAKGAWGAGEISVWNADPVSHTMAFEQVDDRSIKDVVFSSDGQTIFTLGSRIRAWHVSDGENYIIFPLEYPTAMAISPDQSLVAGGSSNGDTYVWDAKTGEQVALLVGRIPISSVVFSANGKSLVTLDKTGVIRYWAVKHQ